MFHCYEDHWEFAELLKTLWRTKKNPKEHNLIPWWGMLSWWWERDTGHISDAGKVGWGTRSQKGLGAPSTYLLVGTGCTTNKKEQTLAKSLLSAERQRKKREEISLLPPDPCSAPVAFSSFRKVVVWDKAMSSGLFFNDAGVAVWLSHRAIKQQLLPFLWVLFWFLCSNENEQ